MRRLVLVGVGLIGGSLALDLKRAGLVAEVAGIDIDADNLTRALERRVVDYTYTQINAESVAEADMVLIATPVNTLPAICRQLVPYLSEHCIVTDVGSTKQLALKAFAAELPHHYPRCVAAHPIAGSDRHGALAAQFGLFAGKNVLFALMNSRTKLHYIQLLLCGRLYRRRFIIWMRHDMMQFLPLSVIYRICWLMHMYTSWPKQQMPMNCCNLPAADFGILPALQPVIRRFGQISVWLIVRYCLAYSSSNNMNWHIYRTVCNKGMHKS